MTNSDRTNFELHDVSRFFVLYLFRLTYTSAFVLELQRYHPIAPLAGPRRVLNNTVIDGYLIPKDTTVLISVGDIHIDPELWGDPHVFKPERFIDERGMIKNTEHMYPFGLGESNFFSNPYFVDNY